MPTAVEVAPSTMISYESPDLFRGEGSRNQDGSSLGNVLKAGIRWGF